MVGQVVNGPSQYGREAFPRESRGRCHQGNGTLENVMPSPWTKLRPPAKGGYSTGADAWVSVHILTWRDGRSGWLDFLLPGPRISTAIYSAVALLAPLVF